MLSESSYLTAIYSYCAAAVAILLIMGWWLGRHWRAAWVAFTVLLLAAVLLTPAHPNADTPTYAPALVVATFESLTNGPEAARHAFKPLAATSALAAGLAILLRLVVFRRSGAGTAERKSAQESAQHGE